MGYDPGPDGSCIMGYEFILASRGCDLRGVHCADQIVRELRWHRLDLPVRRTRLPRVARAAQRLAKPLGVLARRVSPRRRAPLQGTRTIRYLGLDDAFRSTAPEWVLLTLELEDAPRPEQRAAIRGWLDEHEPSPDEWRQFAEWALTDRDG